MEHPKNIIREQTLHFEYNGNADGFALQKEVSDWCNFNLIPEIELQLDEFSQNDTYLRIDRLEIDAEVDSKNWKQKLRDELLFELKQKLTSHKPAISEINKTTEAKGAKLDTLIIFYLKNGYLPWWGKAFLDTDFKSVFKSWITEKKSAKRIELIREELQHIVSQRVAVRIVEQVPEKLFFHFLKDIYQEHAERFLQFEAFFETFILNNISKEEQRKITKPVYVLLLFSVVKNKGEIEIESIFPLIYKELEVSQVLPNIIKNRPEEKRKETNPVVRFWQKFVSNEQKKQAKKTEKENPLIRKKTESGTKQRIFKKERLLTSEKTHEKLSDTEKADKKLDEMEDEIRDGIYIDNAGAVIFAAFIPTLFEKLGLTENGKIVDPDLATSIIQYSVSGQLQIEEYELVLPKILCGLDIDFPIDTSIELNEDHISEVDSMLQSLISHWPTLGNTSVEGLREAFLNRSGKLSFVDGEWLLVVEQKAYDMLLERIPWSFSIIKLPWMETMLKTEWI